MRALTTLLGLALAASSALANVEKVIFLGPKAVNIPSQHPTISDLHLDVLNPGNSSSSSNWSIRTNITAGPVSWFSPPHGSPPEAKQTWLLLDNLTEGQRYEVRICWAATQPTDFTLRVHEVPKVFADPGLIGALSEYSHERLAQITKDGGGQFSPVTPSATADRTASVLFLQVFAAADYYTTDEALMKNPPPVLVDIILDPFILNVLPRSLVPTVFYVLVVAVISWFVARRIADWLQGIATAPDGGAEAKKKQ